MYIRLESGGHPGCWCCILSFLFIYSFIYLAAFNLRCCTRAFSGCIEQGLLFVAVRGLLTAVVSLVAELGL